MNILKLTKCYKFLIRTNDLFKHCNEDISRKFFVGITTVLLVQIYFNELLKCILQKEVP